MIRKPLPSMEYLRSLLIYDETAQSGLIWKHTGIDAGKLHKRPNYNSWNVCIDGVSYKVHNILWKLLYNEELCGNTVLDHINNNAMDNRLSNLRKTNTSGNSINRRSSHNSNTNFVGVCKVYRKHSVSYISTVVNKILGNFDNLHDAIYSRVAYMINNYKDFSRNEIENVYRNAPEVFEKLVHAGLVNDFIKPYKQDDFYLNDLEILHKIKTLVMHKNGQSIYRCVKCKITKELDYYSAITKYTLTTNNKRTIEYIYVHIFKKQ